MPTFGNGRRVAIVAGVRTPFARSGTALKDYTDLFHPALIGLTGTLAETNAAARAWRVGEGWVVALGR